jgi:hypothetical protein
MFARRSASAQQPAGRPLRRPRGLQLRRPPRLSPSWCRPGRPSPRRPGRRRPRHLVAGRPAHRAGCPRRAQGWQPRARATTPSLCRQACWCLQAVLLQPAAVIEMKAQCITVGVTYLVRAHWPMWCPRGLHLAQSRLTWLRWRRSRSRCGRGWVGAAAQEAGSSRVGCSRVAQLLHADCAVWQSGAAANERGARGRCGRCGGWMARPNFLAHV